MRNAVLVVFTIAACLSAVLSSISTALAQAQSATISGTVLSATGSALGGAKVAVAGPVAKTATTAADGTFSISVPPGMYRLRIDRGGYQSASQSDVSAVAGVTQPLNITLSETSLSSLRTIGAVTATSSGRGTINLGPASQTIVPSEAFTQTGDQTINEVLQHVPDIVVSHQGTEADTSIVVGGLQPYETQVLIDGHPIALGQYGVWTSNLYPSFLIGAAEVESGPGNTTEFANIAVGGTVNLTTPSFTKMPKVSYISGTDAYGSIYNNLIGSGSVGKFSYVGAAGQSWNNTPTQNMRACDVYHADPATSPNTSGFAGIVPFCEPFDGSLFNRGLLLKAKYDFSSATSFQAEFIGSYAGYSPQDYYFGEALGPTLVEQCIPGTLQCTSPVDQSLVGKTISGYFWYPGTVISNKQQLYSGQLRTSIGNDTILLRPYGGNIEPETFDGTNEGTYPSYYAPGTNYPACSSLSPTVTCFPGVQSLPSGVQIPSGGLPNPNAFENSACPVGTITSYNQINSPKNTITTVNGREQCYQYPYSTSETDTLYGTTVSYIHPFANNVLNVTYDFHGESTFAYADAPQNFQVPAGSTTRFSTISLTGELHPAPKLAANIGLYDTLWTASGDQPHVNGSGNLSLIGLQRSVARFDPHIALVFRPRDDTSIRAAWGNSETFPFIGLVSGPASISPPNVTYTGGFINQKNPNLLPEASIAFSLGADHRFSNGGILGIDLLNTTVHNVFQSFTLTQDAVLNGVPAIFGVSAPYNVARLEAKVATIQYSYAPHTGIGYNVSLAADSSVLSGIPAIAYGSSAGVPADGIQICGDGRSNPGVATCVPYLKGYGQLSYAWRGGTFAAIGADYEGKNNAFYQPPFAVLDFSARHPVMKDVDLQLAIQNVFNNSTGQNLPAPNVGVPVSGDTSSNGTSIQQAKVSTFFIPAEPRTVRLQVRVRLGH